MILDAEYAVRVGSQSLRLFRSCSSYCGEPLSHKVAAGCHCSLTNRKGCLVPLDRGESRYFLLRVTQCVEVENILIELF